MTLAASVRGSDGAILYTRVVTGEGHLSGLLLMTPDGAREALEKALPDAVTTIVSDPDFQKAMWRAGSTQARATS